jgi:Arc/MetJ-type ribon-helix-helix transcriptional regulator
MVAVMATTPLRQVRIPDDLYQAVRDKAHTVGKNVSEVIRDLLQRWIDEDQP